MRNSAAALISGAYGGRTVSFQSLARRGAKLLGSLQDFLDGWLSFDGNLGENIRFGDEVSAQVNASIEAYIQANSIDADNPTPDPQDEPAPELYGDCSPARISLSVENIGSLIWCTGFTGSFDWIRPLGLKPGELPNHTEGVSEVPGLYFVGLPWQRNRKSNFLWGIVEDAEQVVTHLAGR